jgi:protection-of-telomeres protein 1
MPSWEPRSSVGDAAPPPLPPRFTTIKDILDGDIKAGSFVNVIGVVKECQLPVATAGKGMSTKL